MFIQFYIKLYQIIRIYKCRIATIEKKIDVVFMAFVKYNIFVDYY